MVSLNFSEFHFAFRKMEIISWTELLGDLDEILPVKVPSMWVVVIRCHPKLLYLRETNGWGPLGLPDPVCDQTLCQFSSFLLRNLEIKAAFLGSLEALHTAAQ